MVLGKVPELPAVGTPPPLLTTIFDDLLVAGLLDALKNVPILDVTGVVEKVVLVMLDTTLRTGLGVLFLAGGAELVAAVAPLLAVDGDADADASVEAASGMESWITPILVPSLWLLTSNVGAKCQGRCRLCLCRWSM